MNRRELLLGSVALAGAAIAGSARAAESAHTGHEHHHGAASGNAALAAAAADCMQKGQVCLNHCLDLLAQGDKDMAACAKTVNQAMALCGALQQLANQNSKQLAKLASLAMDACKECEDECKKHADKHESCKACADSCAACYKECKKIAI